MVVANPFAVGESDRSPSGGVVPVLDTNSLLNNSAVVIDGLKVNIVDTSSGQTLRSFETGGSFMWATLRASAGELLISDVTDGGVGRLSVYDVESGTELRQQIAMPNRVVSNLGYDPAMQLSTDEGTLFYESRTSICPQGGDSSACDVYSVGVIDLSKGVQVASVELPQNCGYGRLAPFGQSDTLITCPNVASVVTVRSSGAMEQLGSFTRPSYPAPVDGARGPNVVFGGVVQDSPFMLFSDGSILSTDGSDSALLPADQRVDIWSSSQTASGTLVVAYAERSNLVYDKSGMPTVRGILIVDPLHPRGAVNYSFEDGISYVYPISDNRLALLNRDAGTIQVDSITPSGLVTDQNFSASAYWIAK